MLVDDENISVVSFPFLRIEEECTEVTAEAIAALEQCQNDLQTLVNLSNFLLNPELPISLDPTAYFSCSNSVFETDPCCVLPPP